MGGKWRLKNDNFVSTARASERQSFEHSKNLGMIAERADQTGRLARDPGFQNAHPHSRTRTYETQRKGVLSRFKFFLVGWGVLPAAPWIKKHPGAQSEAPQRPSL